MHESAEHAALVELFRHHPELAAMLAARVGKVALPAAYAARVGDPALKPGSLAADVVIELRDAQDVVVMTLIVEVQRDIDEDKLLTWPAYLWLERRRRRCDCILLVIATRREVAAWADRPIHGGPGSVTRVMVLGPEDVPRITDLAEARAHPALAVLSAAMHDAEHDVPVLRAGLAALRSLPPEDVRQYSHLVFRSLSKDTLNQILEDIMQEHQQGSRDDEREPEVTWDVFVEAYREALKNLERSEGRAEVLFRLLERRGVAIDDAARTRVRRCRDLEQFDGWIDRAHTATSLAEVFGE